MKYARSSGILLHITSLPGRYGIGDLGLNSYKFIDFLSQSAQRHWQFLPVTPVDKRHGNSPYKSPSAFAGNPLLIDPDQLVEDGLLDAKELAEPPPFSDYVVDFETVWPFKKDLLSKAFENFKNRGVDPQFDHFCSAEGVWLDDYSLFMALKEENDGKAWHDWPRDLATRNLSALDDCRDRLGNRILYRKFLQYCFHRQWQKMVHYAGEKGVSLIGDIPIYVSRDSADVWAHQDCFKLDSETLMPTHVAGVPPDYFSDTGQLWGNPLFRWNTDDKDIKERLYSWWRQRFKRLSQMVDIVRIDHFRGFEAYWEVPAGEKNAVNGEWVPGPGKIFFAEMAQGLDSLAIIAEDLGIITPEVEKLRDDLGLPGMKVLQFAFDSDATNSFLPHNYSTTNCVVYTGTHDNDTTVGWFLSGAVSQESKDRALRYANSHVGNPVHWDFIRMALASVAALAIVPMQDVLGFGSDCRMNIPSTTQNNWRWRCAPENFSREISARLKDETIFYGRAA